MDQWGSLVDGSPVAVPAVFSAAPRTSIMRPVVRQAAAVRPSMRRQRTIHDDEECMRFELAPCTKPGHRICREMQTRNM
eukprot:m.288870 g.288870  ORF g.288870 m.288870 type:complete len:79 (-) comp112319_c0_seq1:15-251(-)